jgi:two-component system nitrogen regulation sensor histidine kinase NtrY
LVEAMAAELPGNRTVLRLPDPAGGGTKRSYTLQVALVGGAAGPMRLGVLTDIQSELQAAEAAALRQLMQLLSHELMNSLTPVASLAESAHAILVEEGAGGVARAAQALEVILRRTRGLDGFVRGYRTLARLLPPDLRPVSATALLDDAAALFRTRWGPAGVMLAEQRPVPDIIFHCDDGQVTQALLKLLANAVEATLADQSATSRNVGLAASARASGLEFLITDNGPGVPTTDTERIFSPVFTTKNEGVGIGLALARQIALAHGGTLQLVATTGRFGATFA